MNGKRTIILSYLNRYPNLSKAISKLLWDNPTFPVEEINAFVRELKTKGLYEKFMASEVL